MSKDEEKMSESEFEHAQRVLEQVIPLLNLHPVDQATIATFLLAAVSTRVGTSLDDLIAGIRENHEEAMAAISLVPRN